MASEGSRWLTCLSSVPLCQVPAPGATPQAAIPCPRHLPQGAAGTGRRYPGTLLPGWAGPCRRLPSSQHTPVRPDGTRALAAPQPRGWRPQVRLDFGTTGTG